MNAINKQLARSFADAGNQNNLDAFDSILTKGFQRHCEATPEVSVLFGAQCAGMHRCSEAQGCVRTASTGLLAPSGFVVT